MFTDIDRLLDELLARGQPHTTPVRDGRNDGQAAGCAGVTSKKFYGTWTRGAY
jgi:hypothetical protein